MDVVYSFFFFNLRKLKINEIHLDVRFMKYVMPLHLTVNMCTLLYIITTLCFVFFHSKEHLIGQKFVRCKMISSGRERLCMTEVYR